MRRDELERRVDELSAQHDGADFADAVRRFSEELDEAEREELKAILLRKARAFEDAMDERFEAKGWIRRQLGRLGDPRDDGSRRR
jgi:hypothetical protein